mgnify:CR=1 FL=1
MKILKSILICSLFFLHIWVSADYVRSIEDESKIHVLKERIETALKKSNNADILREKYQKLISRKLSMTHNELKKYSPMGDDSSENLKEYILKNIYSSFLTKEEFNFNYMNYFQDFKILENDYLKTVSKNEDLFIDNNWIYYNYHNWDRRDLLSFLYIDKNTNLKEYVEKNFLEKEFVWKCEVVEKIQANFWNTKQKTYYIEYTPEYKKILKQENNFDLLKWQKCGKFWYGSIFRKTDTIVFYYPRPFEWSGEDFSLFEIKKWNE